MSRITNDVNQVQQAVSETVGDLMREGALAGRPRVLLFYQDARLALVAVTGAPLVVYPLVRFGRRIRSTTRRSQEQLEQLSHVDCGSLHRPPHREGIRRRTARGAAVPRRVAAALPDQHEGHERVARCRR